MKFFTQKSNKNPVNSESIAWAYRIFLDREPETPEVVADKIRRLHSLAELRHEIILSTEFQQANFSYIPVMAGDEPGMEIEEDVSPEEMDAFFNHIQDTWQHLGEVEPHWSVLTAQEYLANRIDKNLNEFYAFRMSDLSRLYHTLDRNQIQSGRLHTCLEYGCGLGRVTRWLAGQFETVYGYDISKSHLLAAEKYLSGIGIHNVSLRHVNQLKDITGLPKVDLVYSVIVLQHNPPPLISLMIREFIRALNPGGIAYFQLPTYRKGYSFTVSQYLKDAEQKIEMHVLPQRKVFEIVRQEGGKVIEVIEDGWAGGHYKEMSNTFLVQKE